MEIIAWNDLESNWRWEVHSLLVLELFSLLAEQQSYLSGIAESALPSPELCRCQQSKMRFHVN